MGSDPMKSDSHFLPLPAFFHRNTNGFLSVLSDLKRRLAMYVLPSPRCSLVPSCCLRQS